ncbi:hypothetical protein ACC846_39065, partial [Rhizobium ruizarguesonis]
GPRPDILADVLDAPWRTNGDTFERIELLSAKFVSGERKCPEDWKATRVVLSEIEILLKPSILACGPLSKPSISAGPQ